MSLFSQRKGIRPLEKAIQRESIDEELRNRLWSAMSSYVWNNWRPRNPMGQIATDSMTVEGIIRRIWMNYFKRPTDTIPDFDANYGTSSYGVIREHFLTGKWWQAYDLLEFLLKAAPPIWAQPLKDVCNGLLEEENSAYRIIDLEIVEITDDTEVAAIEEAIEAPFHAVETHFKRALALLSDRDNPDYRNSIKESISAVEAACRVLSGNPKATLGDALKMIDSQHELHPAMKGAFSKLYGYTSDAGGLRHALDEESVEPPYSEAKFMLVACSAFTNFLWAKAAELGLSLKKT